jgi:type IV pilus assembly protein PilX
MADFYCFKRTNTGAVLISALLFLLVFTLLAMSILRTSLLETKMSANYHAKILALQDAEANLAQKERHLNSSEIIAAACGVTFYRLTAGPLQSTYSVIGNTAHCHPKPTIHPGRQSWREVD